MKLEPWHIDNTGIFRILTYLKPNIYSEPSQRFFKMECFAKIVKNYCRSLTGYWNCPSFNKYSLTFRMTSHFVLYEMYWELWHIQNTVYYCKLRHSDIFRSYLSIFWHIQNPGMFRTMCNSYILGTLPYLELRHSNKSIFWTLSNILYGGFNEVRKWGNYSSTTFSLSCLTKFWAHLCLNKCRVTLGYVLYQAYWEP